MFEGMDDRSWLEEQQQQQLELLKKLDLQAIRMKEELINGMYWEVEKRIKVYNDFGLSPSGMFYSEMKRMFTKVFASALMDVFIEGAE